MAKITNQDVINSLRSLPEQQKISIALEANIRGLNVEKDIVPVLTNITNVYIQAAQNIAKNCKVLLGENYESLKR